MPLKKCGDNGWKWGDNGKCYTGPGAKKKAIKQGIVIEGPDKFSKKVKSNEVEISVSDYDAVDSALQKWGLGIGDRAAFAINLKRYLKDG